MTIIVEESNYYADAPLDEHGNTKDGPHWENLTVSRLQAFMALVVYID